MDTPRFLTKEEAEDDEPQLGLATIAQRGEPQSPLDEAADVDGPQFDLGPIEEEEAQFRFDEEAGEEEALFLFDEEHTRESLKAARKEKAAVLQKNEDLQTQIRVQVPPPLGLEQPPPASRSLGILGSGTAHLDF